MNWATSNLPDGKALRGTVQNERLLYAERSGKQAIMLGKKLVDIARLLSSRGWWGSLRQIIYLELIRQFLIGLDSISGRAKTAIKSQFAKLGLSISDFIWVLLSCF